MALLSRFFKPEPELGWVQCPSIVVPDAGSLVTWCPEFGFRYVLVIAKTGDSKNVTKYDAALFQLRLTNGQLAMPIGIVPGVSPGFRARPGEPVPKLMCTEKVILEDSESPWLGVLYCIEERYSPAAVMLNGVWREELRQLSAEAGGKPSEPTKGKTKLLSSASLTLPIPFYSDQAGSMERFSTFRHADRQDGILAVGRWDKYCIIAARIPENKRASLSNIETATVQAILSDKPVLRDHSSLTCMGLIYPNQTQHGLQHLLVEKANLSGSSHKVEAAPHSTIETLSRYAGPVTVFAPRDWKLVLAFDYKATGEILFAIKIGTLRLQLAPGTEEWGFAKQSG